MAGYDFRFIYLFSLDLAERQKTKQPDTQYCLTSLHPPSPLVLYWKNKSLKTGHKYTLSFLHKSKSFSQSARRFQHSLLKQE